MDSIFESYVRLMLVEKQDLGLSDFLRANMDILATSLLGAGKNGVVLHPSAKAMLVLSVIASTVACFTKDAETGASVIDNLSLGDKVLYNKNRYIFHGLDDQQRVVLEGEDTLRCWVPLTKAQGIVLYNGGAKTLGGKGIRSIAKARRTILSELFKVDESQIKGAINASAVIVCSRQEADWLMESLYFKAPGNKPVALSEIFPAAYYTPQDVYDYAGNSAKSPPVLRFTSKLSIARDLTIGDSSVRFLVVSGSSRLFEELSELSNLSDRKSLASIVILSELSICDYEAGMFQLPNFKIFAWTKRAIEERLTDIWRITSKVPCFGEAYDRMRSLIEGSVSLINVSSPWDNHTYDVTRKKLYHLLRLTNKSDDMESFLSRGFSVFNLLTYSCFPLIVLDEMSQKGLTSAIALSQQVKALRELALRWPEDSRSEAVTVVRFLEGLVSSVYSDNPKFCALIQVLRGAAESQQQNTAVVFPKEYYYNALMESLEPSDRYLFQKYAFVSRNRMGPYPHYDKVIAVGTFSGREYNPYFMLSKHQSVVLYYREEEVNLQALEYASNACVAYCDLNNSLLKQRPAGEPMVKTVDEKSQDLCNLEETLAGYGIVRRVHALSSEFGDYTTMTDVASTVMFETGETAFLTKRYCPYILDMDKGEVYEADVADLAPGDTMVFATNDNETRDIASRVLDSLVESGRADTRFMDAYVKTRHWKEVLRNHMATAGMTFQQLSAAFGDSGFARHSATIRSWLDDESHIIGPREPIAYKVMGILTREQSMLAAPDSYCEACNEVRSMRIRALKYIGRSIVTSLGRNAFERDGLLEAAAGDITRLARAMRVVHVAEADNLCLPTHLVNRPLNL